MTWLIRKYATDIPRAPEGAGAGAGAGAQGAADGGAAAAASAAAGGAAGKPWYDGIDAEIVGYWDNRSWKKDDPKQIAIEATKATRAAQQFVGVPPEQIIKLPKDATDEAGWKAVYARLGVPDDAKGYDLSTIKRADGKDLDAALTDGLRSAMLNARVAKDRAGEIAKAVVKHMDDQTAAQAAERAARLQTERAAVDQEWGSNSERNRLLAMQGRQRLGLTPETVQQLENALGYKWVMDFCFKIGRGTTEDTFHDAGQGGGAPTTRAGAAARLAELEGDKEWGARLVKGDVNARREMDNLLLLLHGDAA